MHFSFSKSPGILFFFCFFLIKPFVFFVFFVFFGFLEVFWIFAFLLLQESWNIVFFSFFVFFGFLEVFWIFAFARVLEYCFSLGFLVFSRFFSFFFYDIVKPQVQIPIKHAKR